MDQIGCSDPLHFNDEMHSLRLSLVVRQGREYRESVLTPVWVLSMPVAVT